MTFAEVHAALHTLGVRFGRHPDGAVHYHAPKGTLTAALRTAMQEHKPALAVLLAPCPVSPTGRHQWYRLTDGRALCLPCLAPYPEVCTVPVRDIETGERPTAPAPAPKPCAHEWVKDGTGTYCFRCDTRQAKEAA
jgi:hypothetical protein